MGVQKEEHNKEVLEQMIQITTRAGLVRRRIENLNFYIRDMERGIEAVGIEKIATWIALK